MQNIPVVAEADAIGKQVASEQSKQATCTCLLVLWSNGPHHFFT